MASNILFTCGVCVSNINQEEVNNHICVKDWPMVTINLQSKTFYPTNERGEYLSKVTYNGKEQILLLKATSNTSNSSFIKQIQINKNVTDNELNSLSDVCTPENHSSSSTLPQIQDNNTLDNNTLEEMLIKEVKKRPPIYNYTLPLAVRGRQKINDLWKEISEALNGLMSPEEAKKKWKSLKDTFSKILAEQKKPSGSARSSKRHWKHFELMSFLRSISTDRSTISNITLDISGDNTMDVSNNATIFEDSTLDMITEHTNDGDQPLAKRQKRVKDGDHLTAINRIVDALCTKEVPTINLPKLPEISALDGVFLYIKERLQKLDLEQQNRLIFTFLQEITKEEQNRPE